MKYLTIWIGMVAANFIYHAITDKDYGKALEWSLAQSCAIAVCYFRE